MPQLTPDFFDFQGLRFYPGNASIVRLRDDATSSIRPKEQRLLTALLTRPGETVTYKELWATVWPELENFDAVRRTMTETKSTLDRLLRDILKSDVSIIQTISSVGYRINGPVMQHPKVESLTRMPITASDTDSELEPSSVNTEIRTSTGMASATTSSPLLSAHPWHLLGGCTVYSLAYVCILLLEVAYGSEQFWRQALLLSPLVFSWIFLTSAGALIADSKLTLNQGANALPLLILSFIASGLILYGMLSFFLPQIPITQATFQTQTAQAAYLKNMAIYFLPLVIVFLGIPFHLVASLEREIAINNSAKVRNLLSHKRASAPRNAIYLRPRTLGILLLVASIVSLASTFWLLDHLKTGPYMNRFTLLVMCRLILYFGLGAECLLWYSRTLNEVKDQLS